MKFYKIKSVLKNILFPPKEKIEFSIGIYTGENPFQMKPYEGNPVLTKEDITDRKAAYIADPFMIKVNDLWYMFFEVRNSGSYLTELAYATSKDGLNWKYNQTIGKDNIPHAYPYIFEFNNNYYMSPACYPYNSIIIYSADNFPKKWSFYSLISKGRDYVDPSIFWHGRKWWCFASTKKNEDLYLFCADELKGPWKEHPLSPVVKKDKTKARPAGRIIEYNGNPYRFAQDCKKYYGNKVRAFKILKLTETEYEEEDVGIILEEGSLGWNEKGMHTFDVHWTEKGWIAAVDGFREIKSKDLNS